MRECTVLLVAVVALGCSPGNEDEAAAAPRVAVPLAAERSSPTDRSVARAIRETLAADESLSDSARGIDVSVGDGTVMLAGEVESEEERAAVLAVARTHAGDNRVIDRLVVVPATGDPSGRAD